MKWLIHKIGRSYIQWICKRQCASQRFRWINERPVEYAFLFDAIARYCPKHVLDVGTGGTAVPSIVRTCGCLVTAIDNVSDYWPNGMVNRHWHVINDDICDSRLERQQQDMVTCISVLEHIVDHDRAVASMCSLLKPNGRLLMSFPYNERQYVKNAYDLEGATYGSDAPYMCQIYSRRNLDEWCKANEMEIEHQQFWRFFSGEFWAVGELVRPAERVAADRLHQHTCLLLRKKADLESTGF